MLAASPWAEATEGQARGTTLSPDAKADCQFLTYAHLTPPDRTFFRLCLPCHYDPGNPPKGDVTGDGAPLLPLLSAEQLRNQTDPVRACPYCSSSVACHEGPPANGTRKIKGESCAGGLWYGGAGLIISVGLVRRLDYDAFLRCTLGHRAEKGSDRMFSDCLFGSGFAITDPGYVKAYGDEAYR